MSITRKLVLFEQVEHEGVGGGARWFHEIGGERSSVATVGVHDAEAGVNAGGVRGDAHRFRGWQGPRFRAERVPGHDQAQTRVAAAMHGPSPVFSAQSMTSKAGLPAGLFGIPRQAILTVEDRQAILTP